MNGGQWHQPPRHKKRGRFRWDRLILVLVFGGLILYGMVKLIGYGIDLLSSAQTSRELQQVYHEEPTETVAAVITEAPATPPTGDEGGLGMWIALTCLSCMGFFFMILQKQKKKVKNF